MQSLPEASPLPSRHPSLRPPPLHTSSTLRSSDQASLRLWDCRTEAVIILGYGGVLATWSQSVPLPKPHPSEEKGDSLQS